MNKKIESLNPEFDQVCQTAISYVEQVRKNVLKSVNHEQVIACWKIGRLIVETEQQSKEKADYGAALIKTLSERLNQKFKRGFSLTNLQYMRQFYQTYKNRIGHKPCDQFGTHDNQLSLNENLGWSHYRTLIAESRDEVRNFYEIEAAKN